MNRRREEREEELRRFDEWCLAHPWQAFFWALGITILVAETAFLAAYGLAWLTKGR